MRKRQKVIGRIHNMNTVDHVEEFKGNIITIKAGGFIEMPYSEAVAFKGQFFPKLNQKKIQLEMIRPPDLQEALKEAMEYACPKCSKTHGSDDELNAHIESEHFDDLDEEVQKEIKKRKATAAGTTSGKRTATA